MSGKVQLFFENSFISPKILKNKSGEILFQKRLVYPYLKLVKSSPISKTYLWIEPRVRICGWTPAGAPAKIRGEREKGD